MKVKYFASTLGALALYFSASAMALSAPATEEEAKRLTTLLQSYTFGFPDIVSVKPAGGSYDLTLDLSSALANLKEPTTEQKLEITVSPIKMKLSDQGSGKWLVEQKDGFDLTVRTGAQFDLSAKFGKLDYTGVFDESLGFFASSKGTASDISFTQSVSEEGRTVAVDYSLESLSYESANERAADGTVNGVGKTTYKGFKEAIKMPATEETGFPLDITVSIADGVQDTNLKGLKTKEVYALFQWAFANISKDAKKLDKAQIDALKPLLIASLPVFNELKSEASYNNISVSTAMGQGNLAKMKILVETSGLVKNGLFREAFTLENLTLPEGIVPPWGKDLMTDRLALDFQVTDFDAKAPAQLALEQIETLSETGATPEFEETLLKALLPTGAAKFTINDYAMVGKTYDLKLEGSVVAGKEVAPKGKGTLRSKSLVELVAAINAVPAEFEMSTAAVALTALSGMAKPQPDGTLLWDMEAPGDGKFLINGIDYAALAALGGSTLQTEKPATETEPKE